MHILLLAPQPFFQERGTPIAVDLVLKVLSERGEQVDVLTYHEGENKRYAGVSINRTSNVPFIKGIRPGFSLKKLFCDGLMFFQALKMASRRRYNLTHAVEESVFIALVLKWIFRVPYIYDMDSSLHQQLVEKSILFTPFAFIVKFMEKLAVMNALAVVPVCDALANGIAKYSPRKVVVLPDVSLLRDVEAQDIVNLRAELNVPDLLMMYVGNLETYQGIDLMLESFALAQTEDCSADLAVIGGNPMDIKKYKAQCRSLGLHQKVHFLGPKPVKDLASYLAQADILVSPRIKGQNTPMKLYSYLHSGKAVLATNLPTHTQVLNDEVAMLADPTPKAFSLGMRNLFKNKTLISKLGTAGKGLVEEHYTFAAFREKLNHLYDGLIPESAPV